MISLAPPGVDTDTLALAVAKGAAVVSWCQQVAADTVKHPASLPAAGKLLSFFDPALAKSNPKRQVGSMQ
jgi:hypothetical protein